MKTKSILFAFMMATLSLSAQTSDEVKVTDRDFGLASVSPDIHSAEINGQLYYYTQVKDKPNYAVIVAKKKAYNKYKEVVLPETFTGEDGQMLTIVGIGVKAFAKCKSIKKVDLPKTVRFIGDEAFGNADVGDLTLREGLVKIGSKAFLNNDLKDIRIPDGVEEIGEEAFYCLKSTIFQRNGGGTLYIPKTVYNIGKHAFSMTQNGWDGMIDKMMEYDDYISDSHIAELRNRLYE